MASTNETMRTGGEILVAALAAHGVDTVFGIPGTHNLAIFAAMPGQGVRNVTGRHEQGLGYAADGYARSSGRVGVVVTTTGPAALNAQAALAQAYSDSQPVLLIAPGMPTGHPSDGNGLLHELRDQKLAMSGVVAESHRVESLAEIPVAVARAFARMKAGRPRAEYLEVPLDLLDAQGEVADVKPLSPLGAARPSAREVQTAATALREAKRTLIITGGGANGAADEVRELAEMLGAPVVGSTNGKATLSEKHELSLGVGVHQKALVDFAAAADVVLAIGTEFAPADWWLGLPNFTGTLIRVDIDQTAILTNATPDIALLGDAAEVLRELTTLIADGREAAGQREQSSALPESISNLKKELQLANDETAAPWLQAMGALAAALPEGAIIAADNAMASYYGAFGTLKLDGPRSYLFPTGVGTLGFGLPAGIGAKVANPEKPVVVIQGDGGIMFSIQELHTAAELGIALPILVFDNGGYGEIHNEMLDRGESAHSVALGSPNFVQLAEALGCYGVFVANASELTGVVERALKADRPTLIHLLENSRAAIMRGPSN